jgi:uracil-DNA glycosylase
MFSAQNEHIPGYFRLVEARKNCRICVKRYASQIHPGASFSFDPEVVSYWSQWLGCLEPKLLIVGQDFGDKDYFQKFRGVDDPASTTNRNLYELLIHCGLNPTPPPQMDKTTPVFLTNSVLCLKEPPMNRSLPTPCIKSCATQHLGPLIELLKPPLIVALGGPAWLALRTALGIKNAPRKISEAAGGMWQINPLQQVYPVGHCGGLGKRNRSWQMQLEDWSRIGDALKKLSTGN